MERIAVEQKLRVPLDAKEEAVGRRFDCLHDTIGRQGAGNQRRGDGFDRLMVRTIHFHRQGSHNAAKQAARCHGDRVTEIGRLGSLPMLERSRNLRWDILKQTAAARYIDRLHTPANAEQREIGLFCQVDDIQFEIPAAFADDAEGIALALAVERRWKVRPASRKEESIELSQEPSSCRPVCVERKDQWDAAEIFDGTNVSRAQKVGGFAPTPFLPITGVEVWCDADDRFHRLADWLLSRGISRIGDSQEADGLVALEMVGGNDVSAVEACGPNALGSLFIPA
jgi:hypothetical protein